MRSESLRGLESVPSQNARDDDFLKAHQPMRLGLGGTEVRTYLLGISCFTPGPCECNKKGTEVPTTRLLVFAVQYQHTPVNREAATIPFQLHSADFVRFVTG